MKILNRNRQTFWYCLYDAETGTDNRIVDADGNETGEVILNYVNPVEMKASISPASGNAGLEIFGTLEGYDKVIITDDLSCPIREDTVLFVDKQPEFAEVTNLEVIESQTLLGDDTVVEHQYVVPLYDYTVTRVSKSLNSISYAIRRVTVS